MRCEAMSVAVERSQVVARIVVAASGDRRRLRRAGHRQHHQAGCTDYLVSHRHPSVVSRRITRIGEGFIPQTKDQNKLRVSSEKSGVKPGEGFAGFAAFAGGRRGAEARIRRVV